MIDPQAPIGSLTYAQHRHSFLSKEILAVDSTYFTYLGGTVQQLIRLLPLDWLTCLPLR